MTINVLVLLYIQSLGDRHASVYYRQVYRQHLANKLWMESSVYQFPRAELLLLKEQLKDTPSIARRVIQLFSQTYSWASQTVDIETRNVLYQGLNPAAGIKKPGSGRREQKMDRTQLRLFLESMDFLPPKHQALFLTRLLSPNRITEVCEMKIEHINLVTGKWFKPNTKTGLEQTTYIPAQAREAIQRYLSTRQEPSIYVFPGFYGHSMQPDSFRKIWNRLRLQLGMQHIQLLDLRRTLASYLYGEIKADRLFIKAVLNHFDPDPTAIYTRIDYDKLATILQSYADWVWALKSSQGGQHVVSPLLHLHFNAGVCWPTI